MAKIKGVWVFNDVVSHFYWLASYQMINVTFTSNGERFTSLYWYDVPAGDDTIYHLSYDETLAVAGPFGNLYNWDNDAYKTVDFGSAEQDVSDEFLAWMQENATQQASEGTTPTAEGVKEKLQSLITASNAKTGKSDANLTDAVKTLLEGYGQGGGGGGECSGNHIIEVDELPQVGVEGAIYSVNKFLDIVMVMGGNAMAMDINTMGAYMYVATLETYQNMLPDGCQMAVCYLTDVPDIYVYDGGWQSYSSLIGVCRGEITDITQATEDGSYALFNSALYQYANGRYKDLVKKGEVKFISNGDGTCRAAGIEPYYDAIITIPTTSPSGDIVTIVNGFSDETMAGIIFPDTVTEIMDNSFDDCYVLHEIYIPASVTRIGNWAFSGCTCLHLITYKGTKAQWQAIEKGSGWNKDVPAKKVTCTDGEITW